MSRLLAQVSGRTKAGSLLALIFLLCSALPQVAAAQAGRSLPFTFKVSTAAATSAGVFAVDGTLVRTLWSGVQYQAGSYNATWDGVDDNGHLAADGAYTVKVVSNNVKYEWEGVIGNTSQDKTGSTVNHAAHFVTNMVVVGDFAYYAVAYTEGDAASFVKFNVNNPQVRIKIHPRDGLSTSFVASDGTYVYWAGPRGAEGFIAATKVADDTDVGFSAGTSIDTGHNVYSAIDYNAQADYVNGLAVQKTGNFLLAAHQSANEIRVFDKKTGVLLRSWPVNQPRQISLSDDNTLWVIHDKNTVEKFTLNSQGVGTATGITLGNLTDPVSTAVSPNGQLIAVINGSTTNDVTTTPTHQVHAYATSNGAQAWVLGQTGGYAADPTVANDKFFFVNTKTFENTDYGQSHPFLAFQPDGSFWVGDIGNLRAQHFSAARAYLNQLAYIGFFYSGQADPNDPTRVFANYLEFKVDYSKPLAPDNGSWQLVRNWSAGRQVTYDSYYTRFSGVTTLSNGRTYWPASIQDRTMTPGSQLVELTSKGLRYTGIFLRDGNDRLYSDGSVWSMSAGAVGQPAQWKRRPLVGFDSNGNPQWGASVPVASTPAVTITDPITDGGYLGPNQQTSTGVVATFSSDLPGSDGQRGSGYHLGGVLAGTNKWLWKTSSSTTKEYSGDFPPDGKYDIGNGVQYAGSFMRTMDRSVFWGYNGEFWKDGQTNKWNHYLDNGLFIGQFGAVLRADIASEEAAYGIAGNAVTGTFVKVGDTYYFYHCDEALHGGLHRWKISGLATIQEQVAATFVLTGTSGLLMQQFAGADLDNVTTVSAAITETVQLAEQSNSVRWAGYVEPRYSQSYAFYASASKKVRLWVNEQLIVNQWDNAAQAEFKSDSIVLAAGTRYAIKMEISGGSAALAWASKTQSKQQIPKTSLYAVTPDTARGIALGEGLPFNSGIENGLYGWSRNPSSDIIIPMSWNRWVVATNAMGINKQNPDVHIQIHPPVLANQPAVSASRNLSDGTTDFPKWTITGKLVYPAGDYDKDPDYGCIQVLDENSKVIARIYRKQINFPSDFRFYFNNQVVIQTDATSLSVIGKSAQPFTITATASGMTFQYAGSSVTSNAPFDPTSNWQHPKTLQVLFYSPGAGEHEVDMSDLRFIAPAAPTIKADHTRNMLSAWYKMNAPQIMVSENNARFVAYAGPITVGNAAKPTGYWKFKLQETTSTNDNPIVESPAFTAIAQPLPVKLLYFNAKKTAAQVSTTWGTTNEVDASAFVVERSADGTNFSAVATVKAENTAGDHTYNLADTKPLAGTSYYRLKLLDTDASFTYSPVVSVLSEVAELVLYPNPTRSTLQVQYPASPAGYLEVLSVLGRKLSHQEIVPGSTTTVLDVQALPQGIYYLQYGTSSAITKAKFAKD